MSPSSRLFLAAATAALCAWLPHLLAAEREEEARKLIEVLKSGAPAFEKAKACQRLAVVGTKESVPVLAGLLADEELGGVVEHVELGEGTDIEDEGMRQCLQDAMYGVTFDPPEEGGRVVVSYPMTFEPG